MTIHTKSYPRAALIGNPSDGYNGKTIAFLFSNFSVDVELEESQELKLIPGSQDRHEYESWQNLYTDIKAYGYYGGIRILKATIKVFLDYCLQSNQTIPDRNFTLRYQSSIPKRLGLAGSSAIITASFRALSEFYGIQIPKPILANLVLSAETDELLIGAGLQDRVAQVYEAPVFMDFDKKFMMKEGYGYYEPFSKRLLPPLYIAFRRDLSEGSEVIHNDLKDRFNRGDTKVREAMDRFSELTIQALKHLKNNDPRFLGSLMNENFDLRKSIIEISPSNLEMVNLARSVGASAKFTGSGGAIIGTYEDEDMFRSLKEKFQAMKIDILKPDIIDNSES